LRQRCATNYLSQNIPNPTNNTTTISYQLLEPSVKPVIEIFDVTTTKVLQAYPLPKNELIGSILVDTKLYPAGLYGYRLLDCGHPIAVKKLSVTH